MVPITNCLKKESFQWISKATIAFRDGKDRMASAPILGTLTLARSSKVARDASGYGISGIRSQEGHLIAFFREKLSESRRIKYTTYEKELYALLQSLRRCPLEVLPFTL